MKKLLSIILATAMILSLIPSVFATDGEETETQKLKIVYDIGRIFLDKASQVSGLSSITEELTDGFFRINDDTSSASNTTLKIRTGRTSSNGINNGFELYKKDIKVSLDVYVPVAGVYTMTGVYPTWSSGGVVKVYINDEDSSNKSYDCSKKDGDTSDSDTSNDGEFEFSAINLKQGWNKIKFVVVSESGQGRVRTFTLTLGDATDSDYALMGVHKKEFIVGDDPYEIKTVKSSAPTEVLTNLTYTPANENVATVENGVITPVGHGKTTVTVSDADGRSYDIAVTVINPNMPTIKYDIDNFVTSEMNRETDMTIITEESSGGFFRYNSHTGGMIRHRGSAVNRCIDINNGKYLILDVYVPAAGMYTMTGEHPHFKQGGSITVYVNGNEIGSYDSKADEVKHPNAQDANSYNYRESFEFTGIKLNKGWNTFKFAASNGIGTVKTFTLSAGSGNVVIGLSEKEIAIGESDTIKACLSSTAAELTENVTYVSDNSDVAKVENGEIKAVGYGDANITVTYSGEDVLSGMNSFTTKVSVKDAKTSFVSIGIDENGDGTPTVTSAELGNEITVEAADRSAENMIFRGWVRGSAENGHLVWTEPEYTFTATTHTYITAIYSPVDTSATDEYYNWDGQFLGNTEPATVPSLVGYTFAQTWTKAKVENLITSWIADFTKNDETYDVTGNGFTMTKDDNKYDTEVTCTSDNGAVYWYRDGKLVDYGTEYKFFIWDKTEITTSNEGHNGAKLMLDAKKGNSYMVEYDAGNATLLEVGILFAKEGDIPTVETCEEKMSSQRNLNEAGHGQFSATSEYPVARGYLIYKDGNTYRVIYTD